MNDEVKLHVSKVCMRVALCYCLQLKGNPTVDEAMELSE